jgi:hypothetical protein
MISKLFPRSVVDSMSLALPRQLAKYYWCERALYAHQRTVATRLLGAMHHFHNVQSMFESLIRPTSRMNALDQVR